MIKKRIKVLGVIPARYDSVRFPGKPLVEIGGTSMVMRVYKQASLSFLDEVIVATDHQKIYDHVIRHGGKCVLTSSIHETGTERCAEVLEKLNSTFDAVINIQGDEPFIHPDIINKLIHLLKESPVEIGTFYKKIKNNVDLFDQNVVKLVIDKNQKALLFSRQTIPFVKNIESKKWLENHTFFKHIGIYGYQAKILQKIVKLPKGNLETVESLEQLRWLENGFSIYARETEHQSIGIDTPQDLEKAKLLLKTGFDLC